MNREKIPSLQLCVWILSAVSAPLAQIAGKEGWLGPVAVGAVCLLLCFLVELLPTDRLLNKKWYCLIQLIWLPVVLSFFLRWSARSWPTGQSGLLIPLTLLLLAVISASYGNAGAARAVSVLLWFLVLLYVIIILSGVGNIRLEYLSPQMKLPSAVPIAVFLLPAVKTLFTKDRERSHFWIYPTIAGTFALLAVFAVGALSPAVSQSVDWPLYESGKSLNLLGVAERFEVLVSVAVTIGYFSLSTILLTAAGDLMQTVAGGRKTGILLCAAASSLLLLAPEWQACTVALGTLFLWIILPGLGTLPELKCGRE